jgi:hypothetical protein
MHLNLIYYQSAIARLAMTFLPTRCHEASIYIDVFRRQIYRQDLLPNFCLFVLFRGGRWNSLCPGDDQSLRKRREEMVRTQIATLRSTGSEAVRDPRALDSLHTTPRHRFVPAELVPYAYDDRPIPIDYGQTISQPHIVAKVTELLESKGEQRILEIGTGSGYQAAGRYHRL